jgi:GTP-binding protein
MSLFRNAAFVKSAATLGDLPESAGEIAFAGRSNAGKSSAINALIGRRLAFVSKTPGRTQLINFFALGNAQFLVDLPGYGYSRVPAATRAGWEDFLGGYLLTRAPLRGAAVVMDIRHPLTELDRHMLGWFGPTGKPVHVLLTKSDKLSRSEARTVLARVQAELALLGANFSAQLFSSLGKSGLDDAETVFRGWLGEMQGGATTGDQDAARPALDHSEVEKTKPRAKRGNGPGQNALEFQGTRSGRRSGRRPKPPEP